MNAVIQQSTVNTGIKALHDDLMAQHKALSDRLSVTTSADDAEAIVREMQEVNFRVMMSGRLLFKQTTAAISSRPPAGSSGWWTRCWTRSSWPDFPSPRRRRVHPLRRGASAG